MTEAPLYCANHPDRPTTLRCNRCNKPICSKCAVLTPVGYRCKECVRGQQAIFETAHVLDYGLAVVVAGIGVGLSIVILNYLRIWGLLAAPVAGGGIAEVIRWGVRGRRSRHLPLAAAVGGVVGVLPHVLLALGMLGPPRVGGPPTLGAAALSFIWPIAFGAIIISTLFYRLRGIRL